MKKLDKLEVYEEFITWMDIKHKSLPEIIGWLEQYTTFNSKEIDEFVISLVEDGDLIDNEKGFFKLNKTLTG